MKAPFSVKGCGGAGGLELRPLVPPGIPDGLFPPLDIKVHPFGTWHRSRKLAPMQGNGYNYWRSGTVVSLQIPKALKGNDSRRWLDGVQYAP